MEREEIIILENGVDEPIEPLMWCCRMLYSVFKG